jgi:predicted TIM-barrel enzyme/mannose-6-phosphate isomerase-like protein (cupin superfamily)
MAAEVLPAVRNTPVLAGVCGTDPFCDQRQFLMRLKEIGFSGVQNFPTVGVIDGNFRLNLEETGMGYGLEVEMIRIARSLDLLTCPYAFNEQEARDMAEVGADVLVAHMGLTGQGSIGGRTVISLEEAAARVQSLCTAAHAVNPGTIVLCHGGPIAEPDDARYILEHTQGVQGFFGASSIERLSVEKAIADRTTAFKEILGRHPGSRFVEAKDVESQVFEWGRMQWMSTPTVTGTRQMAAGTVTLEPGKGHARHNHRGTEEVLYVIEGRGFQTVEDGELQRREISAGVLIHIPAGAYHETINAGPGLMRLLAVYCPPGAEALLRTLPDCRIEPPAAETSSSDHRAPKSRQ